MSRRNLTHRERWLTTVCDLRTDGRPVSLGGNSGAPRQQGSFRVVMALLSMYADNDTGANARPSLRLLQQISHYKYTTVRRALSVAETAGYITATGNWIPPKGGDPITVWALGYPTDDGFAPWSVSPLDGTTGEPPVSPSDGTTAGESTGRNHRPDAGDSVGRTHRPEQVGESTGRNVGESTGRTTTSSTSRPQGSEDDEDESACAPAPEGADTTRLEAEIHDVLRRRWPGETPVVSNRSRRLLAEMLAAGWTEAQIAAAVNTIGKNPRNPALLLESHLEKVAAEQEPRNFGVASNVDSASAARRDPAAIVTADQVTAPTTPATRQDADEDDDDPADTPTIRRFAQIAGHTPRQVADVINGIAASTDYTVSWTGGDEPWIMIQHYDLPDSDWRVLWQALPKANGCRSVLEARYLGDWNGDASDRFASLWADGIPGYPPDAAGGPGLAYTYDPHPGLVARFVEVTGPIARAAAQRAAQAPQKPAKATPTPRPATEVLAGDDRDPGADGFATIAKPSTVRPPGHDQAVREADQAERRRQQDALNALSEEQLAALVALQQAHTTDQEDTA